MAIDKYLRIKQVCELTGLSRATIYAMEKKGDFPAKKALGARAVAWLESEIAVWMESRKTAVKSGREAKPGRPPMRKKGSPRIAGKSKNEPQQQVISTPTDPSGIVVEPTDEFADWSDAIAAPTDTLADWSDVGDTPQSPNLNLRPPQASNKGNASKDGPKRITRRGRVVNVVAEFNASALSKSKLSK